MYFKVWCIILFFILDFSIYAQVGESALQEAEEEFSRKNYLKASFLYADLYNNAPYNKALLFKYAEALRMSHQYSLALEKYKECYSGSAFQFPMAVFYSGEMHMFCAQYEQAIREFRYFSRYFYDMPFYASQAKQYINACRFALQTVGSSIAVLPYEKGNSNYFEYVFVPLHDSLYAYTSFFDDSSAAEIALLKVEGQSLLLNQIMNWQRQAMVHVTGLTYVESKSIYYFSAVDSLNASVAYLAQLNNDKLVLHTLSGNSIANVNHPYYCIFQEKPTLFFVSDIEGNNNIYYSFFINDSVLETPVAIVNGNSVADEICPFYHSESNRLYFSSNWHSGYGGFDVFFSTFDGDFFSEPVNAGYGINSSKNDMYFRIVDSLFYVTSNRDSNSIEGCFYYDNDFYVGCLQDIHFFTKPKPMFAYSLYFDINIPMAGDTVASYSYYWNVYSHKLRAYKDFASQANAHIGRRQNKKIMDNFLTQDADLEFYECTEMLKKVVERVDTTGERVEIILKGYTSNSAGEQYNMLLAGRRVVSVEKEIYEICKSVINRYPETITITQMPIGKQNKNTKGDSSIENIEDRRVDVFVHFKE